MINYVRKTYHSSPIKAKELLLNIDYYSHILISFISWMHIIETIRAAYFHIIVVGTINFSVSIRSMYRWGKVSCQVNIYVSLQFGQQWFTCRNLKLCAWQRPFSLGTSFDLDTLLYYRLVITVPDPLSGRYNSRSERLLVLVKSLKSFLKLNILNHVIMLSLIILVSEGAH